MGWWFEPLLHNAIQHPPVLKLSPFFVKGMPKQYGRRQYNRKRKFRVDIETLVLNRLKYTTDRRVRVGVIFNSTEYYNNSKLLSVFCESLRITLH